MKSKNSSVVPVSDKWSAKKAQLEELSAAQAHADIEHVVAQRELVAAQTRLERAIAAKTTAEKKLAAFRLNLGAE